MTAKKEVDSDVEIGVSASLLAQRLSAEVGYPHPKLIEEPLVLFAKLMGSQLERFHFMNGAPLNQRNILENLLTLPPKDKLIKTDIVVDNIKRLTYPRDRNSFLSKLTLGLMNTEDVSKGLSLFDYVNSSSLGEIMRGTVPAHEIDVQTQVFHRFIREISGEIPQSLLDGKPRIVITNGYKKRGNHISFAIDIPDSNKIFKRVLDLYIGHSSSNNWNEGKDFLEELRSTEIDRGGLISLAVAASEAALEHGYLPFGAVLMKWNGQIVVARNDTNRDRDTHKHAEFLASEFANQGDEVLNCSTEPCPACTIRLEGSDLLCVNYALMQPREWSGVNALQAMLKRRNTAHNYNQSWVGHIPRALNVLKIANDPGGKFPGQFDETIALNSDIYEAWDWERQAYESRADIPDVLEKRRIQRLNSFG